MKWSCKTYVLAGPQQLGLFAILLKLDCESELERSANT